MTIKGTKGNDKLTGTSHSDTFDLSAGGNDIANGVAGDDTFIFKTAFTAADQINGGSGNDVVELAGNYSGSHAVTFGAKTLVSVETITVAAGHDYKLTTNTATVANHATMTVDGSKLGTDDALTFNGSHETNGHFNLIGGAGADVLTGGSQSDTFDLTHGHLGRAVGGAGDDTFNLGDVAGSSITVSGGAGNDTMSISNPGANDLTLDAATFSSIETILVKGAGYDFFEQDDFVAAGKTLVVDGHSLKSGSVLYFNNSDTDGHFIITAGAGDDIIGGGAQSDTLSTGAGFNYMSGGGGDDTLILKAGADDDVNGGAGADLIKAAGGGSLEKFEYAAGSDSSSTTHDTITGVNFADDTFRLNMSGDVTNAGSASGTIRGGHFDSDLVAILGTSSLLAYHGATIVEATGGNENGHSFLVVDQNGNAAYDAGTDFVIDITGHTGTMTTGNFIAATGGF